MIVPNFWAEARIQHRESGRQVTIRRFGWSDDSQEDAEANAQTRAEEAMKRVLAGEKLDRREFKVSYNGADGIPIREEILSRHGDAVITRNSYGAPCLNTPDVLFLDVDYETDPGWTFSIRVGQGLTLLAFIWAWLEGSWKIAILGTLGAFVVCYFVAGFLMRIFLLLGGGVEKVSRRRVERFSRRHPDWNLRLYRTPAGLRILATHRTFRPDDPEVDACFKALHVDKMYARMCRNQRCFRARLGPKPWRMGIGDHMRPRPGVWPVHPDRLPLRQSWIAHYEARSTAFAACQFLTDLGSSAVDPKVEAVQKLHDDLCRVHSGLSIA